MRTTLDLPESLLIEAMKLTKIPTRTGVIKAALSDMVRREKLRKLTSYGGKVDLKIDLDKLRDR